LGIAGLNDGPEEEHRPCIGLADTKHPLTSVSLIARFVIAAATALRRAPAAGQAVVSGKSLMTRPEPDLLVGAISYPADCKSVIGRAITPA